MTPAPVSVAPSRPDRGAVANAVWSLLMPYARTRADVEAAMVAADTISTALSSSTVHFCIVREPRGIT